ncbi:MULTISPECIES: hypothetical protein [Methylomicrobium]|uniref:Uncharacterized protein n=1 Tax=Methylomicrobium album BG8 TaxID=686340 RepID=H8GHF2_METAL|nr:MULTISPECIES: hypothetical protein [Methylomicrobium]EIC30104.1 hypothetical protein Metal_2379 [Methylomicrobium album BG8]
MDYIFRGLTKLSCMRAVVKFFALACVVSVAYADTYPAVPAYFNNHSVEFSSLAAVCASLDLANPPYVPDGLDSQQKAYFCKNSIGVRYSGSVLWRCPYGGAVNFSPPYVCSGAPACPVGMTRDLTTGECSGGCAGQAGDSQKLAVKAGTYESSSDEVYDADVGRSYNNTVSYGGQEYAFMYPDDFAGTCWSELTGNHAVYCDYNAFSTGVCSDAGEQAKTQTPSNPSVPASKSASGNQCVTDAKGNTICSSSPKANQKCGELCLKVVDEGMRKAAYS